MRIRPSLVPLAAVLSMIMILALVGAMRVRTLDAAEAPPCGDPPAWPYKDFFEVMPLGPQTDDYDKAVAQFLQCREAHEQAAQEALRAPASARAFVDAEFTYLAAKVRAWNGDIFWEPASKSTNPITEAGDEARAVFGDVLDADCRPANSKLLLVEVDGNQVDVKPNAAVKGNPLQFDHTDTANKHVKWTTSVDKCDKPSPAGGVTFCAMSSRISYQKVGNVSYIVLCRKTKNVCVGGNNAGQACKELKDCPDRRPNIGRCDPAELSPADYWKSTTTDFKLLGYIIFNSESGEVAFFDGDPKKEFKWKAFNAPGGKDYNDGVGRTAAEAIYDPLFQVRCVRCHDNFEPQTITPYIKQARVGYKDKERRLAFSADTFPESIRQSDKPYRVVGSSLTAVQARDIAIGKSIEDPSAAECTRCHPLTNLTTGRKFAVDALGRLPATSGEMKHLTLWARNNIHPWMTDLGPDVTGKKIGLKDYNRLKACFVNAPPEAAGCKAQPLYTGCPAPESKKKDATRIADPAGPKNTALVIKNNRNGDNAAFKKEAQVKWKYRNTLGGVPKRDDVRFHLAIREVDIPKDGALPETTDYPTVGDAIGDALPQIAGEVYGTEDLVVVKNVSYTKHEKFTEPADTKLAMPRDYEIDHPVKCDKRYLYRLVAKRFCFDESNVTYSEEANGAHTFFVDVPKCP